MSNKDIDNIKNLYLTEDYIEFLKISNGAELFIDDYHGSQAILKLYSLDEIIEGKEFYSTNFLGEKVYPIGIWLDSAELLVDEIALKNNKDYLSLADGSKTFTYGFQELLDKIIIAQGHEFWLLDVSYD